MHLILRAAGMVLAQGFSIDLQGCPARVAEPALRVTPTLLNASISILTRRYLVLVLEQ